MLDSKGIYGNSVEIEDRLSLQLIAVNSKSKFVFLLKIKADLEAPAFSMMTSINLEIKSSNFISSETT